VHGVQQTLDQEIAHSLAVERAEATLHQADESGELETMVLRPADGLLLRRNMVHLAGHWQPYTTLADVQRIIGAATANRKTILVTIGHGGPGGETHFPAAGMQTQTAIANAAHVGTDANTLYLPLQCYPQVAVRNWRQLGGTSESIQNDGRSDDHELLQWIDRRMESIVRKWLR
jgi:hypothetical protein